MIWTPPRFSLNWVRFVPEDIAVSICPDSWQLECAWILVTFAKEGSRVDINLTEAMTRADIWDFQNQVLTPVKFALEKQLGAGKRIMADSRKWTGR